MRGERVIVAIDSFKGSLTSSHANQAAREALLLSGYSDEEIECIEVSDGGEGFLDAVSACIPAEAHQVLVHGPLMRTVTAVFLMAADGTAYIESASVCGYTQVPAEFRHPRNTTSYGLGELIIAALRSGARRLVIGLGGTCTCDAGLGMLQGLGAEIRIAGGNILAPGAPAFLAPVTDVGFPVNALQPVSGHPDGNPCTGFTLPARLLNGEIPVEVWSDTEAVFNGTNGAVMVFGPQKGIAPQELETADRWFENVAGLVHLYRGLTGKPGTGAAGGLGMAISALPGGRLLQGGRELLRLAGFSERFSQTPYLKPVGLVITGEGRFDSQTLSGKMPARIAGTVRNISPGTRTFCLCGMADIFSHPLFDRIIQITPPVSHCSDTSTESSVSFSPAPASGVPADAPSADDLRPDVAAANLRRALCQNLSHGIG